MYSNLFDRKKVQTCQLMDLGEDSTASAVNFLLLRPQFYILGSQQEYKWKLSEAESQQRRAGYLLF